MVSLADKLETVAAKAVRVTDGLITVSLDDGRTVSIPTKWYPRLLHATPAEGAEYEIDSHGVMWPRIEADFSIRGILLSEESGESSSVPEILGWTIVKRAGR